MLQQGLGGAAGSGSSSSSGAGQSSGSLLLNTSFSSITSYSSPLRELQLGGRPHGATPAQQKQQHLSFSSGAPAAAAAGVAGPSGFGRMSLASSPLAAAHRMHSPQLLRAPSILAAASPLPYSSDSFLLQSAEQQHQAAAVSAAAATPAGAAAAGTAAPDGGLSFFSSIAAAAVEAQARAAAAAAAGAAAPAGTAAAGPPSAAALGAGMLLLPPTSRLSLEEIKRELAKHKLECPESMWKEPETEQVQGLYSFAIEAVFRLTVSDVRMEELAGGGDLRSFLPSLESLHFLAQDGRLHAKAIGNLRFFRLCQKLNRVLGLPEFTRETFAAPTPQVVLRFASACCSFLRLREGLLRQVEPLLQQHGQLQQQLHKVKCDLRALQEELQKLRREQQVQQPIAQQRKQQEAELHAEIDRLRKTLEPGLVEEQKRKTQQHSRLQEEVEALAADLSNLKQERDDLLSQVIHSPEKLMARREELRQQQRQQDQQLLQLEGACAQQQQLQQLLERGVKKVKKALHLLSTHLDALLQPQVKRRSEMRVREKGFKELKEQRRSLQQAVQQLQQQREGLQQQLQELQETVDKEAQQQQQHLVEAQQHVQQQTDRLFKQQEETAALRQERDQQATLLQEQQERQQQLLQALEGETQKLLAGIQTYFAQVDFLRSQLPLDLLVSQPPSGAAEPSTESLSTRDLDDDEDQESAAGAAAAAATGGEEQDCSAQTAHSSVVAAPASSTGEAAEDLFCSSNSTGSIPKRTLAAESSSSSNGDCTVAVTSYATLSAESASIAGTADHSQIVSTAARLPREPAAAESLGAATAAATEAADLVGSKEQYGVQYAQDEVLKERSPDARLRPVDDECEQGPAAAELHISNDDHAASFDLATAVAQHTAAATAYDTPAEAE